MILWLFHFIIMRGDRIVVGEVRGQEAIDMLQSVNVGHSAMTTVHANSVRNVVSRLETMVLMEWKSRSRRSADRL